jgi:hypothetical protein
MVLPSSRFSVKRWFACVVVGPAVPVPSRGGELSVGERKSQQEEIPIVFGVHTTVNSAYPAKT